MKLDLPNNLKDLSIAQLKGLCDKLRDIIITTVTNNGGHLSSNLGVVELTVALHYVFNFPEDKIVFDVGHQCYAHKLLSGRQDDFDTIRMRGGLSGFPKFPLACGSGSAANPDPAGRPSRRQRNLPQGSGETPGFSAAR